MCNHRHILLFLTVVTVAHELSSASTAARAVVKSEPKRTSGKVSVYLFIESRCPFSRRFIQEVFKPVYHDQDFGQNYLDLGIYTFGNAEWLDSREGGSAGLQCQHGQEECEGDKAIQCAQEQKLSDSQLLEFVTCLMQEKNVISRLDECATSSGYDATQLRDCVYSYEGEKLALASRSQIDREYPDMNGVPSWKINGKKDEAVQGSQLGFLQALCRALRNPPVNVCGHEHLLELSLNMMQPYGRQ